MTEEEIYKHAEFIANSKSLDEVIDLYENLDPEDDDSIVKITEMALALKVPTIG